MIEILAFGISDFFYDSGAVFFALFLIFLSIYFYILRKIRLGKERRNIAFVISLAAALLTVYVLFRREYGLFELPTFNFFTGIANFFRSFGFIGDYLAMFFDFLAGMGILGIFVLIGTIYLFYVLGKAFVKYIRINWGI